MRKDWEYKKLGEVATFNRGLTYSGKDEVDFSENIVLRSNNIDIDSNTLNLNELKYISDEIIIPKDKRLKRNSIFICMSNGSKQHLGKVAFIDKDYSYAFGGFMGLISPEEKSLIPKFLYYFLCSTKFKLFLTIIGNGANINNIKFSDISKVNLPLPQKSTQLSIVAELDKINELIQLKKQQLKDYDQLAQSIFYEMFGDPVENEKGWEVKKLGEVCETSSGGTPSKTHTEYYENGTIPWLRSGEVSQGYIYDAEIYISELGLNKSSAKIFPKDTVLIAMYGATVGEVGILCNPMCTNQAICGILPNDLYNSEFLRYVLLSHKDKYLSLASGGAQPNISQQIIKSTLIPFIDKPLQQQFAARIEAIERQKQQVSETIKDLETLLASRMQYWFD